MPIRKVRRAAARVLRSAAQRALRLLPVDLWRRVAPRPAFGVCYHMVSDVKLPHLKHYAPVSTQQFDEDVRYLRSGFRVVDYDEAVRMRSGSVGERDNAVLLTFDDGFAECATVIAPILRRHHASAVFFIVTDLVDNRAMFRESKAALCVDAVLRRPAEDVLVAIEALATERDLPWRSEGRLSRPSGFGLDVADLGCEPDPRLTPLVQWLLTVRPQDVGLLDLLCERLGVDADRYLREVSPYVSTEQLLRLHADGFTIGAHTRSHPKLQELSRDEAEAEIVESCRIIRELTGQESVPFAFPYSGWGLDRSWLARIRAEHDFVGLFFDTGGLRSDAPFVIQRVFGERVSRDRSMEAILRSAWARSV